MAKTFKFGENGKWATKTGSSLAYNDQNGNFKPAPFSVTRGSIAIRVNKQGLIEVVGHDKLRIDYKDSSKGVALLEPARSNVLTYSEDFSQWLPIGTPTIDLNNIVSPDGNLNGTKITRGSNPTPLRLGTPNILNNAHTFTLYAKKGNYDKLGLDIGDEEELRFILTDEWQRFELTSTPTTYNHVDITLPLSSSGDYIYIYGAQLEAGSYATSYIPTSGAAVLRRQDGADGAGNAQVFNDSEGVLFANVAYLETSRREISINNGSINERVSIRHINSDNTIGSIVKDGGATYADIDFTLPSTKLFTKAAFKYKSGDSSFFVNGFKVGTSTDTFAPSGFNELSFHEGDVTEVFRGKVKEIGVYDAVLTDAELEALTSYTSFTNMANELNLTIK